MIRKNLINISLAILLTINITSATFANSPVIEKTQKCALEQQMQVNPLVLVNAPEKYLNKEVKVTAVFDKFTALGLDYKPAFRSSKEHISFLIQRDNIAKHTLPMPELKLIVKRSLAENLIELESGDKIEFSGKVFSNALSDAWIDVTEIKVLDCKSDKLKNKVVNADTKKELPKAKEKVNK